MSRNGQPGKVCREDGCDAPLDVYQCRGYCLRHYRFRRLAGEFGQRPCQAEGCEGHAVAKGLCELHRNRMVQNGQLELQPPRSGSEHYRWKGGRSTTSAGYVMLSLPPEHPQYTWGRVPSAASGSTIRRVLEHRLVMGVAIGRPLRPSETVHHVNGDRTDNRIENLQLRQSAHGPGIVAVCADCGSHNLETRPL